MDSSHSLAVKGLTIVEQEDGGVSEMVLSFLIEFAKNFLRVAKHGDQ